ncbi:MAG: hypothetical protein MK082_09845 [Phycisphaerales bacterium]|nr:hypothetical protein [Phycisphaerales bacterium]
MAHDPLVIHTETISDRARAWLADRVELLSTRPGEDAFESNAARAEGLLVRTYTDVDDALLDRMPALKVVGRAGVGLDNIDLDACRARGIEVVHTPEANTQAVVEYVYTLLFELIRPRIRLETAVDADTWGGLRSTYVGRRELDEMTFGVLGLGKIGRRVAAVAGAFGARTIHHDLLDIPEADRFGSSPVTPETLFAEADILSIHVDGRRSNHDLVGADLLGLMKPDSILINTSRGFVIEEAALDAHLLAHPDATALLDVHASEPIPAGSPLLERPNARLTPHLASRTASAMERMSGVVEDVWAVLQGTSPRWSAFKGR